MDKKKLIASVVAILLTVVAAATQIDLKGAVCGAPAPAASAAQ